MLKVETPPLGLPVGPFYVVGTEKKYRQSNLLDLPQELVDLLVNRLGQDSLAALACVCKYFDAKTVSPLGVSLSTWWPPASGLAPLEVQSSFD